ncbi:MAG: aldo/keto reductase [Candidatus Kariarchaeaceae archaeon]|jgi:aryl-alcohol dehydrogenase-like predicted oxidoreductase
MKYRRMGKNGIQLSEISIGTMYYGSYISKDMALKCLNEAVESGINFIDCANRYGIKDSELPEDQRTRAEIILGQFLQNQSREDLVISTKVHHQMRDSVNSGGLSRKHIREEVKVSMKNLQTDYIDVYFCHRPDHNTPMEETIRTMSNLIDEGSVNYWGTSWHAPHYIERLIAKSKEIGGIPPSVEQPPYHMGARFIETDLLKVAKYHGLGLTTFEALNSGIFTGKYIDGIEEGSRADVTKFYEENIREHYKDKLLQLLDLSNELGIPMNHIALAWTLRHEEVTSTLTGASKPEQIRNNAYASGIQLNQDTIERIEEIMDNKPREYYR